MNADLRLPLPRQNVAPPEPDDHVLIAGRPERAGQRFIAEDGSPDEGADGRGLCWVEDQALSAQGDFKRTRTDPPR